MTPPSSRVMTSVAERGIAQESCVLLADEPVASLDPETAAAILSLLRDLTHTAGLGVLSTLHQPHLVERFADRVLTMEGGRLTSLSDA
jgi:phosphonate transport system ATP-binding protein